MMLIDLRLGISIKKLERSSVAFVLLGVKLIKLFINVLNKVVLI
jgi:hypothetical protein